MGSGFRESKPRLSGLGLGAWVFGLQVLRINQSLLRGFVPLRLGFRVFRRFRV